MYISSFHIDTFGIFSNTGADALKPGLIIFQGRNGAGKTTCLEFLRGMLAWSPREARGKFSTSHQAGSLSAKDIKGEMKIRYSLAGEGERELILVRNPGKKLAIFSSSGAPLSDDVLIEVMGGVGNEVYSKIFGFTLKELEDISSLNGDGIREIIYDASFGPSIAPPSAALMDINMAKEELFAPKGGQQALNAALGELHGTRHAIAKWRESHGDYDNMRGSRAQLDKTIKELQRDIEESVRELHSLKNRQAYWGVWEERVGVLSRLEGLNVEPDNFPFNGARELEDHQKAIDGFETELASDKIKLSSLREQRDSRRIDPVLEAKLQFLRGLAENKGSYRQAVSRLPAQEDDYGRLKESLAANLRQLGPGWDCERIRATDRSLFANSNMENKANDLARAEADYNVALHAFSKAANEARASKAALDEAKITLENLPVPEAELDDNGRDELRQDMTRIDEIRKREPDVGQELKMARNAFIHDCDQVGVKASSEDSCHQSLVEILSQRETASEMAAEINRRLAIAQEAKNDVQKAQELMEDIKRRKDDALAAQKEIQTPSRESVNNKVSALRNLINLAAALEAENERLADIEGRIDLEKAPLKGRNWFMPTIAIILSLAALAIFVAHWGLGLAEINVEGIILPVNIWAGYGALALGVCLLAAGMPGRGPEARRQKLALDQLLERRDTSASRVAQLEAQKDKLMAESGADTMDPISLQAMEARLEHEREQCIHDEHNLKEIEKLKKELAESRRKLESLQIAAQKRETEVQVHRQKWHHLMQSLNLSSVPLPENEPIFFARAEAAAREYDHVQNIKGEWDKLWAELNRLEEKISRVPAVKAKLEAADGELGIEEAVDMVLENCREADLARDKRLEARATIVSINNELERALKRQKESSVELETATRRRDNAAAAWRDLLTSHGLADDLSPDTARNAFKLMDECLACEEKAARVKRDMELNRQSIDGLRSPLEKLLLELGRQPETNGAGDPDWPLTLDRLLSEAERNERNRIDKDVLSERIAETKTQIDSWETRIKTRQDKIATLVKQGGAKDVSEFLKISHEVETWRDLRKRLEELDEKLAPGAGNNPFDEFLNSFRAGEQGLEADRINELDAIIKENTREREKLAAQLTTLDKEIKDLCETAELSSMLQDQASQLEKIDEIAEEWSKLAFAEALMQRARDTFEKTAQPEVIREASRLFSRITNGDWVGISASLEDSSLNILPRHGAPLSPAALSKGAAEQAFLALRLAFIREHASKKSPLPLMIDEALVNFDPERAENVARTLVDLGKDQQILYFTCHPYMVEILRKASPAAPMFMIEDGKIRPARQGE